jgi:hypothetical protein
VVRLGMECYRLTYSLRLMWAQNRQKKTVQKAGSWVDRGCRVSRPAVFPYAANALREGFVFFIQLQEPSQSPAWGRCPSNSA